MRDIGNYKRRYKSQDYDKELKKSRSATNMSLVLLPYSVGMDYVHHHVEKYSCQATKFYKQKFALEDKFLLCSLSPRNRYKTYEIKIFLSGEGEGGALQGLNC